MGMLNLFGRDKNVATNCQQNEIATILEEEIKDFFPKTGVWYNCCFKRPEGIASINMPCHLRDNLWMSKLLRKYLINKKGLNIPQQTIKNFIDSSESFAELRHNYELEIVNWQINWIMNGGEHWLMPNGYDEISFKFSQDVDKIVRGGVVKTLKAIGMNEQVIEEGLETNNSWRVVCMSMGFRNKFEPVKYLVKNAEPADDSHRKNWMAAREYMYYQEHKNSVDKYGTPTPAMKMTQEEYTKLSVVLKAQNAKRKALLESWQKSTESTRKNDMGVTTQKDGDTLSK